MIQTIEAVIDEQGKVQLLHKMFACLKPAVHSLQFLRKNQLLQFPKQHF